MSLLFLGDTKRCPKCRKYKPLDAYHKNKRGARGIASRCKDCVAAKNKYTSSDDRFWKTFRRKTERVGACLIWKGQYTKDKPVCRYQGKRVMVRRLVYRLAVGALDDDTFVLMTCNTVGCVSQKHMRPGTRADVDVLRHNARITALAKKPKKERKKVERPPREPRKSARQSTRRRAKLTEQAVRQIRSLYAQGDLSYEDIAQRYEISKPAIGKVIRRDTWKHVDD